MSTWVAYSIIFIFRLVSPPTYKYWYNIQWSFLAWALSTPWSLNIVRGPLKQCLNFIKKALSTWDYSLLSSSSFTASGWSSYTKLTFLRADDTDPSSSRAFPSRPRFWMRKTAHESILDPSAYGSLLYMRRRALGRDWHGSSKIFVEHALYVVRDSFDPSLKPLRLVQRAQLLGPSVYN